MAAEPWNRVNIPIPSVVSCVRIPFDSSTDERVKSLLMANDIVLSLLRSDVLQTEVRLLYELLYVLNNNYRMNKTFRALKQVEQSINRLKEMKLDVALRDLKQLCPTKVQRALGIESGNCDVPSQPMLEWFCLKALGAAQLMGCAMNHCSRTCIFAKQLLKLEEFIVLNVVFISMLSRLWVFFRGILSNLGPLYKQILVLLREVSEAHSLPYLTGYSLPKDMGRFLAPHGASLLAMTLPKGSSKPNKCQKKTGKKTQVGSPVKANVNPERKMGKEDLGKAIQRDQHFDANMSPLLEVLRDSMEAPIIRSSHGASALGQKHVFYKRVSAATTFAAVATHLKDMIPRCRSLHRELDKRRLTLLYLKCQKMRSLESAGYKLPRKLRSFKQEVLSTPGQVSRAGLSPAAMWRRSHPKMSFRRPRARCGSVTAGTSGRRKGLGRHESSELSVGDKDSTGDQTDTNSLWSASCSEDEIDNIFSFIGL